MTPEAGASEPGSVFNLNHDRFEELKPQRRGWWTCRVEGVCGTRAVVKPDDPTRSPRYRGGFRATNPCGVSDCPTCSGSMVDLARHFGWPLGAWKPQPKPKLQLVKPGGQSLSDCVEVRPGIFANPGQVIWTFDKHLLSWCPSVLAWRIGNGLLPETLIEVAGQQVWVPESALMDRTAWSQFRGAIGCAKPSDGWLLHDAIRALRKDLPIGYLIDYVGRQRVGDRLMVVLPDGRTLPEVEPVGVVGAGNSTPLRHLAAAWSTVDVNAPLPTAEAVDALFGFLDRAASGKRAHLAIAATARAAADHLLASRHSLVLEGPAGRGKTALANLGACTLQPYRWPPHIAANFGAPGGVEAEVALYAGLPCIIDDANPDGQQWDRGDERNLKAVFERVIQSRANLQPLRLRMSRSGERKNARYMQAMPTLTCLHFPGSQFLMRRVLLLELADGDVDVRTVEAEHIQYASVQLAVGLHLMRWSISAAPAETSAWLTSRHHDWKRQLREAAAVLLPDASLLDEPATSWADTLVGAELIGRILERPEYAESLFDSVVDLLVAQMHRIHGRDAESGEKPGARLLRILGERLSAGMLRQGNLPYRVVASVANENDADSAPPGIPRRSAGWPPPSATDREFITLGVAADVGTETVLYITSATVQHVLLPLARELGLSQLALSERLLVDALVEAGALVAGDQNARLTRRYRQRGQQQRGYAVRWAFITGEAGEADEWDDSLASQLLQGLTERESAWHDAIAPDFDLDSGAREHVDALVNAAFATQNVVALRRAVTEHERFARAEFERWRVAHPDGVR